MSPGPWTPAGDGHEVLFCPTCGKLWSLSYDRHHDLYRITELPETCLSIMDESATPDDVIEYVLTDAHVAARGDFRPVARRYFAEAEYPLAETADRLLGAIERADTIEPTHDLLAFLLEVVLRAHRRTTAPTAERDRRGGLDSPTGRPGRARRTRPGGSKAPLPPTLPLERFGLALAVPAREDLYSRLSAIRAAHAKLQVHRILRLIEQYGFPPVGDVVALSPEDTRELKISTDLERLGRHRLATLASTRERPSEGEMRRIVEAAVILDEAMTVDSRFDSEDIEAWLSLRERLAPLRSDAPDDTATAAFSALVGLLEKAAAYDLVPTESRARIRLVPGVII